MSTTDAEALAANAESEALHLGDSCALVPQAPLDSGSKAALGHLWPLECNTGLIQRRSDTLAHVLHIEALSV